MVALDRGSAAATGVVIALASVSSAGGAKYFFCRGCFRVRDVRGKGNVPGYCFLQALTVNPRPRPLCLPRWFRFLVPRFKPWSFDGPVFLV